MTRYANTQLPPPDARTRKRAEEMARDAGAMGATRIPDEALFAGGADPSDSQIVALLQAFEAGHLVHRSNSDEAVQTKLGYETAVAEEMLQLPESV